MKKVIALVLAIAMLLCAASAMAEVKLGQVEFAAHGTKCFAVMTAAVDTETGVIVAAHIDEFQPMAAGEAVGVPNGETIFADMAEAGQVLGSKRLNNGLYSTNMAGHAGATLPLGVSYDSIEAFVVGKTIAELEAAIEGKTKEEMVDVVSSCTLVDTLGYVTGLLEAAKAANNQTGYYTVYNTTGETVSEVTITVNATGEKSVVATNVPADGCVVVAFTMSGDIDGHHALTFAFKTEGGYEAAFETLSIETAPINMMAVDALTGATPISFFAPAPAAE